jgi:hypothetical protein
MTKAAATDAALNAEKKDAAAGPSGRAEGAGEGEAAMPSPDGMMAGVAPGAKTPDVEQKKMLPVTAFGRYVKILLSSNEFIFVS